MISAETDYAQGFAKVFLAHKGDLEIFEDNYIEGNPDSPPRQFACGENDARPAARARKRR